MNADDPNIGVALGVALGRMGRHEEAVEALRAAVRQDEKNPWAHRNLGTMLLRTENTAEAVSHFRTATQMLPNDQLAWLGLADAYRLARNTREAEHAYLTAVQINPHNELAEKARAGSNLLAQSSFEQTKQVFSRQDAVYYCLEAMKRFAQMPQGDLQKLTLELAMAGRDGFAVHDPNSRYRIKQLEGEFSGLAMVCFMYVAMQRVAPGTDIGFDVAAEYEEAKKMFEAGG
jgi:tetratricopeptide (TPR) repeat protein